MSTSREAIMKKSENTSQMKKSELPVQKSAKGGKENLEEVMQHKGVEPVQMSEEDLMQLQGIVGNEALMQLLQESEGEDLKAVQKKQTAESKGTAD